MDPRLLSYYESELRYIREMGSEFAQAFPKVAGRLGLEGFECADPYVERLFEGFAFLAARVHLKMDAEFPNLVQHLLNVVFPHYLPPTPSMAIVQFEPDYDEGSLAEGFVVPRHTALRALTGPDDPTACEYRTSQDVCLWPLELVDVRCFGRDSATVPLPSQVRHVGGGLRLRLRVAAGHRFGDLQIKDLPVYLCGREETPGRIYEQLCAQSTAVVVQPASTSPPWQEVVSGARLEPMGFEPQEAILPFDRRTFQGYRLLREYFAFHQRFLFVRFADIGEAIRRCDESEVDIIVLFQKGDSRLERVVNINNAALHCCPAVNLFPKRTDAIHVDSRQSEYHVVPERSRPLDFEIYELSQVVGHGTDVEYKQEFLPFYSITDKNAQDAAFYTARRMPRIQSSKQKLVGPRSSYTGSELFLSLVDANNAPFSGDLRLLTVEALCTNRDLPLQMPLGLKNTDFTLSVGAPVRSIRCRTGPTAPQPSLAHVSGDMAWKFVSHLSLNYLSLVDENDGANSLKEILRLYSDTSQPGVRKQVDGVRSISSRPVIRPLPTSGPLVFGRGLELTLTMDEEAIEGIGAFLMGAVLEQFFEKYVSINSFTELVLRTEQRKEIKRWPMRIGRRPNL